MATPKIYNHMSILGHFYKYLHTSVRRCSTNLNIGSPDLDMPVQDLPNPYEKEKRSCILCKCKIQVDYKNTRLLSQFLSPFTGKIYERNITGLCKKQQEIVETEIRKSRSAGLLAFMLKKTEYMKDPKISDPNRPVRPHRF